MIRLDSISDPRTSAGLDPTAPMAVALSGGADSVALLHLCLPYAPLVAMHVHHGIRGEEADRDAAFCRTLCQRLGVKLTVLHIDAPAVARERSISLETAAREERYRVLCEEMQRQHIPLLLTAHHANDQLETMLIHLLRGCGLNGLCGIPPVRPLSKGLQVARPLLAYSRDALRDYLERHALDFIHDSTNDQACCTRNSLRLSAIPDLLKLFPSGADKAADCASLLREDEEYLLSLAREFLEHEGEQPSVAALCTLPRPVFARVARLLLQAQPQRAHVDALWELCNEATPHAALSLPGVTLTIEQGRLCRKQERAPLPDYSLTLHEGENPLPQGLGTLYLCKGVAAEPPFVENLHKYTTCISLCTDKIKGDLLARPRRAGDRILSGGMHKAVRRLKGLSHLPPEVRAQMPILCDDTGVLAVPFGAVRDAASTPTDLTVFLYFN